MYTPKAISASTNTAGMARSSLGIVGPRSGTGGGAGAWVICTNGSGGTGGDNGISEVGN